MKAIWEENSLLPRFESLKGDKNTDVLIIGAGITGILTAYFLKQSGIDYILVEKDRICRGVTSGTTAKITYQHGLIYSKILNSYGLNIASGYLEANRKSAEKFAELCAKIDCNYEIRDNYVYSVESSKRLQNEMEALEKIGYKASLVTKLPLPIKTVGAVVFPKQAQFNPLKFVGEIARGLNIYEKTCVKELIGTKALTDKGNINAKRIVIATHFPFINKHGSYFLKLYQHRSYEIALQNAPDYNGMYVDEAKTGLSFRSYGDLLLLGGGSHRTGKQGGSFAELRAFAKEHYPNAKEKYFWATQDCMSLDGIPYIGSYSADTPNLYTATGFNKWGFTSAMTAALLLCDLLSGKKNRFSEIFNPSRSILKPQLFINGIEFGINLLSPAKRRCPHLGCALKWNAAEHSWDCPCHGSRFTANGRLLDNPATGDLKK